MKWRILTTKKQNPPLPEIASHPFHGGRYVRTIGALPVAALRRPEALGVVGTHAARTAQLYTVRVAPPTERVVALLQKQKPGQGKLENQKFYVLSLTLGAGTISRAWLLFTLGNNFIDIESVPPLATLSFVSLSEW